ncbi:MAG: phosphotransferase [Pseudomonadota bacterium]
MSVDTTWRMNAITALLAKAGWAGADLSPLAGDASNRRYLRATLGDARAVVMDAPKERGEDTRPFLAIARVLSDQGLSAPRILAQDTGTGVLLLEDLGDALFARWLDDRPGDEMRLYSAAIDCLVALHNAPAPADVAPYGPEMPALAALAVTWYAGRADTDDLRDHVARALEATQSDEEVLVLRDFHAENLLWLPDRASPADVGLLDFQDARLGHPAYDLASLLRDARRDVGQDVQEAMIARYVQARGLDADAFTAAFAVQSAQRNLRILGVFARLSLHFGKPHYVDLIPRVWRNLMADLRHPVLADLAESISRTLPPPDPTHLKDLKDRCATLPLHPPA